MEGWPARQVIFLKSRAFTHIFLCFAHPTLSTFPFHTSLLSARPGPACSSPLPPPSRPAACLHAGRGEAAAAVNAYQQGNLFRHQALKVRDSHIMRVLMDAVQLRDSLRADWERLVGAALVLKQACYLATLQKQS